MRAYQESGSGQMLIRKRVRRQLAAGTIPVFVTM
jgi:hypothetical protein